MNNDFETMLTDMLDNIIGTVDGDISEEIKNNKDAFQEKVFDIIQVAQESLSDKKVSLNEALQIIIEIAEAIQKLSTFKDMESEDVIKYVCTLTEKIYMSDEGLGNPDLSFVPNFLEGAVEKLFFTTVLPSVVGWLVKKQEDKK